MKRKYKLNEKIFDNLTPDACYWLGFLYGDGSCTRENKISFRLAGVDYHQLIRFRNFIGSDERPIKQYTRNGKPYCGFEFRSWYIHNRLTRFELTRRKENRGRLNIALMNKDFFRGLFDADGSFYYDGRNRDHLFAEITGQMAVLKSIKELLVFNNVISDKKKIVKNGSVFRIRMAKADTIKLIKWMYADSPRYYLSRKYSLAKSYLDRLSDTASKDEATVEKYLKPTTEYNVGKKQEYNDRVLFTEEKCNCK